jgi:hypothetical protein
MSQVLGASIMRRRLEFYLDGCDKYDGDPILHRPEEFHRGNLESSAFECYNGGAIGLVDNFENRATDLLLLYHIDYLFDLDDTPSAASSDFDEDSSEVAPLIPKNSSSTQRWGADHESWGVEPHRWAILADRASLGRSVFRTWRTEATMTAAALKTSSNTGQMHGETGRLKVPVGVTEAAFETVAPAASLIDSAQVEMSATLPSRVTTNAEFEKLPLAQSAARLGVEYSLPTWLAKVIVQSNVLLNDRLNVFVIWLGLDKTDRC